MRSPGHPMTSGHPTIPGRAALFAQRTNHVGVEDDQDVALLNPVVRTRIEPHLISLALVDDADHDGAVLLPKVTLGEGLTRQGRPGMDLHLVDLKTQGPGAQDAFEELIDVGSQDHRGPTVGADFAGRDHLVGSGVEELRAVAVVDRPGEDKHGRVHRAP
jgi:hypothetical protein